MDKTSPPVQGVQVDAWSGNSDPMLNGQKNQNLKQRPVTNSITILKMGTSLV